MLYVIDIAVAFFTSHVCSSRGSQFLSCLLFVLLMWSNCQFFFLRIEIVQKSLTKFILVLYLTFLCFFYFSVMYSLLFMCQWMYHRTYHQIFPLLTKLMLLLKDMLLEFVVILFCPQINVTRISCVSAPDQIHFFTMW